MADRMSLAFNALGDPTRRDMLTRLASGDATATALAERYDLTLQAVAKHLKVLENAGLVTKTRDAQRRPVHLETDVLDMMAGWIRRYQREAEARYQRLDNVLADMSGAPAKEDIA
jgi:DNA-binding transcriptional ArsR family regulator